MSTSVITTALGWIAGGFAFIGSMLGLGRMHGQISERLDNQDRRINEHERTLHDIAGKLDKISDDVQHSNGMLDILVKDRK